MIILSFDCANKSLAYSLVEIPDGLKIEKKKRNEEAIMNIDEIDDYKKIKIKECDVVNLLGGRKVKDVDSIERARCLRKYIDKNFGEKLKIYELDDIIILIEKQPETINIKSCAISDQLLFYFANLKNIATISPTLKNKISFNSELAYNKYVSKYSNSYLANKNHAKANLLYFLKKTEQEYVLKDIKKSNYNDLADSFMQIIAYLTF